MTSVPSNDPTTRAADHPGTASPERRSKSVERRTRVTRHDVILGVALLVVAYLGLTAIWAGLGLLVTGPLADSGVVAVDHDVADWLVAHRTAALDDLSSLGTLPADTLVKIIATAVIATAMLVAWRSWREPLLICCALILEAAVFITVTWIVGRPRPDVVQLDEVSVGTSFPSGHAAAAAAYCAIAIVIFERTRNVWVRTITVVVVVAVPLIVGYCRMYRGVHYLTDVVAGIVLGVACVIAVYAIIRRCFQQPGSAGDRSAPQAQPGSDPR